LGKIKCEANCVGLCVGFASLFILRSVGNLSSVVSPNVDGLQGRHSITGNVQGFAMLGDLENVKPGTAAD